MCIMAVCDTRKMTEKEAESCFKNNSDGAGFAWSEDGQSHYIKGLMTFEEFWYSYKKVDKLPHVAHFRNETSGGVKPGLTHPFIISNDSQLSLEYAGKESLLFHNGVLCGWADDLLDFYIKKNEKIPDGEWSDSRFIAILVHHLGEMVLKFKSGGKYVTVDPAGKAIMYGSFEKEDGIYFSNSAYKKTEYPQIFRGGYSNVPIGGWKYEDEPGYEGYWGGRLSKSGNKVDSAKTNSAENNGKTNKLALHNEPGK